MGPFSIAGYASYFDSAITSVKADDMESAVEQLKDAIHYATEQSRPIIDSSKGASSVLFPHPDLSRYLAIVEAANHALYLLPRDPAAAIERLQLLRKKMNWRE